jgi:hypothetical protein
MALRKLFWRKNSKHRYPPGGTFDRLLISSRKLNDRPNDLTFPVRLWSLLPKPGLPSHCNKIWLNLYEKVARTLHLRLDLPQEELCVADKANYLGQRGGR